MATITSGTAFPEVPTDHAFKEEVSHRFEYRLGWFFNGHDNQWYPFSHVMDQQLVRWLLPELVPLVRQYVGGFYHAGEPLALQAHNTVVCCLGSHQLLTLFPSSLSFEVLQATTLAREHLFKLPSGIRYHSWSLYLRDFTMKVRADGTYVYWRTMEGFWITDGHGQLVATGHDWWGTGTNVTDFCLAPEHVILSYCVYGGIEDLGVWHLEQKRWLWQQPCPENVSKMFLHRQFVANETTLFLWNSQRPRQLWVYDWRTGQRQRTLRWSDTSTTVFPRLEWAQGELYLAYDHEMVVKNAEGVTVRRFPLPPHNEVLVQEGGLFLNTGQWLRALPGTTQ